MIGFTRSIRRPLLCVASLLAALTPAFGRNDGKMLPGTDPAPKTRASTKAAEPKPVTGADRVAKEQYEKRAAEIALRIDSAAATSQENAALLYYQALLACHESDPGTARAFDAVLRGTEPNAWIRVYLGRSLTTIAVAQVASQMPRCNWGPMRAAEQSLDLNLGLPLRRLGYLLHVDVRTLAADGHARAALARCLTIRRLAHHTGDETSILYFISQGMNTAALRAIEQVLGTSPPDGATLRWLKGQLAAAPGTPFQPAQALHKWRDAELQFWRTRPKGRAFTRKLVLDSIPDANDRKELTALTDEQLLVIALQGEQMAPGRYGLSAPPALLERAQQACDKYLDAALQIMKGDRSYREKHAKLQAMVDSLDDQAADGDPIALLRDAPSAVEVYHRLMVRNAVYDNVTTAAIEICLVKANTGQLPRVLPSGLPQDLFTNRDFEYERTEKGFVLRFDPENVSRIQVRQFEFKVRE